MHLIPLALIASLAPQQQPGQQRVLQPIPAVELKGPTVIDRAAGWRWLFDGKTFDGWRGVGKDYMPSQGWEILEGTVHHVPNGGGGDILTIDTFKEFELEFQWGVGKGGNSGIKYMVQDASGEQSMLGPEYQCVDDFNVPDAQQIPTHSAGALYDLAAPGPGKRLNQPATFNQGRIVVKDGRIQHWLNGMLVVDVSIDSPEWDQMVAASKFAPNERFAQGWRGHIGLQDHGDECWFRDLRIRDLSNLPGSTVPIFDGESLTGWREIGDAKYTIENGEILAEVGGGSQSFLATESTFGDFIFEVDVMPLDVGNSGIQVRSHQNEKGRVYGYQIEVDPSTRAWSGGLYDEARRGWLQNFAKNSAVPKHLLMNQWNHYRIECVGPLIRAFVNGVPTAYYFDGMDLEGFIALQVHSGTNTRLRFRNLRLQDLGRPAPRPIFDGASVGGWKQIGQSWSAFDGQLAGLMEAVPMEQLQANPPPPGTGSIMTEEMWEDFTLRCKVKVLEGDFRLMFRWQGSWRGAPQLEELSPGLHGGLRGWNIDFSSPRIQNLLTEEWNDVALMVYGDTITLNVNGQRALDYRDNPYPRRQAWLQRRGQGDADPTPPFVNAPSEGYVGLWVSMRLDSIAFVRDLEVLGRPTK